MLSIKYRYAHPISPYRLVYVALVVLLASCGAAPSVRDSQRIDTTSPRIDHLIFVYRHSDMKIVSSYGTGSVSHGETGYLEFGKFLINQAPIVFQSYGVNVPISRQVEAKTPLDVQSETSTGGTQANFMLLLYATSGRVSANRQATHISYVFNAQVLDIRVKKLIWKANIDTSTWSGRDFIQKNFEKTIYGDAYAKQLLQVIATKMKEDGVI